MAITQADLAEIVDAAGGLTEAVNGKVVEIDAAVAAAIVSVSGHVDGSLSRLGWDNLLTDSGRMYDDSGSISKTLLLTGRTFDRGFSFTSYNGSVIDEAGLFAHDNQNNGGAGVLMTEPAASFADEVKYVKRHGAEFYIARVTAGSGVASPLVGAPAGVCRMTEQSASTLIFNGTYTMAQWVRAEEGSVYLGSSVFVNGIDTGGITELTPADGWVHASLAVTLIHHGYGWMQLPLYGAEGAKGNIALPWLSRGDMRGALHTAPVSHANIYA